MISVKKDFDFERPSIREQDYYHFVGVAASFLKYWNLSQSVSRAI
jgi:hypothetical protein